MLLSTPWTSQPRTSKKAAASDPIRPLLPVMSTRFMSTPSWPQRGERHPQNLEGGREEPVDLAQSRVVRRDHDGERAGREHDRCHARVAFVLVEDFERDEDHGKDVGGA